MTAYTPVVAVPARQLLTHIEDACYIGMESIDLLAALLYAVEQLGSQPQAPPPRNTSSSSQPGRPGQPPARPARAGIVPPCV